MQPPGQPGRWDGAEYQRARRALKARRITYCQHPNCLAPGEPIDYDTFWLVKPIRGVRGSGVVNPWTFDADHITARADDGGNDLRACHARCNRTAGAHLGARRRWRGHQPTAPVHTQPW